MNEEQPVNDEHMIEDDEAPLPPKSDPVSPSLVCLPLLIWMSPSRCACILELSVTNVR